MLRCVRVERHCAVPADTVGRDNGDRTFSFGPTRSAPQLPRISCILILYSGESSCYDIDVHDLSMVGTFLANFVACRMGNAGLGDLCAGARCARELQAFSRALVGSLW